MYRVVFDNGAEINIEAKSIKKAFYAAKKQLIKEYLSHSDEEFRKKWVDSMTNQHPHNAKVIRL